MSELTNWFVIAIAALVAGVFNLPVAFEKLEETSKGLIFFEPLKSPGFWVWLVIQLVFPSLIYVLWVTNFFTSRPVMEPMLFVRAIAAGFGFTAFLNARTETGFLTLDIKSIYDRFVRLGFELIAAQETRRTKIFLRELEQELYQPYANILAGLKDLKAYFSTDITLSPQEERKYIESIDQALTDLVLDDQIAVVQSILPAVRQQDLFDTLQQFNCSDAFLQRYFPAEFGQMKAQA